MSEKRENILMQLLSKLDSVAPEIVISLVLCFGMMCAGFTIVGGMAINHFAPPDPNPTPHLSPAMETLRTQLYRTSNPDLKKYYTEKLLELEEKENSRKQIIVHQIAPVDSETQ